LVRKPSREDREAGVSTVEVVLAVPVMFAFLMTLVYLGFYAENIAKVHEAAADAARMASVQGSAATVTRNARAAAWSDLGRTCTDDTENTLGLRTSTRNIAVPGGTGASAQTYTATIEVTVSCDLTVMGVHYTITESSYAPLDYFREQP
jgi:Flp pilus assembly protein TadG